MAFFVTVISTQLFLNNLYDNSVLCRSLTTQQQPNRPDETIVLISTTKRDYKLISRSNSELTENTYDFGYPNVEDISAIPIQYVAIVNKHIYVPSKCTHSRYHTDNGLMCIL